ncbi:MAG: divergent polysaccharide deacetylase family protein [Thiotrichales bacterium]|nr:MAG: divergent polysaccharide deacetylase family protein [Thiotrichales bacterium]
MPAAYAEKLASIIIDDLGNNLEFGNMAIALPGPVTLAFLPHTVFAADLADRAHGAGKEVMLHLPLQSVRHHSYTPGTLKLHMTHQEFVSQLKADINSIPHVRGLNNHMGSLLTQHPGHMNWLMSALAEAGDLYFIDSRTTKKSVASRFAQMHRVPHLDRDIFLDPDERPETIRREFSRFIARINRNGFAIAIAHPYPQTIQFIEQHLDTLEGQGIKLVPVSELIARKHKRGVISNVASTGAAGTGL